MQVLYIDESGDHNLVKIDAQYPILCLAGCMFNEEEYKTNVCVQINTIKEKYFHSKAVILHSRDIRKRKGVFNVLQNQPRNEAFINDINTFFTQCNVVVISACIQKLLLNESHKKFGNIYELAFQFMIERYVMELEELDDIGYVSIESRDPAANAGVSALFSRVLQNGTKYITKETFQKRLLKLELVEKHKNINGHQIADLVAYPIARHVLNLDVSHPSYAIIEPKLRSKNKKIMGYGLKLFPNSSNKKGPEQSQSLIHYHYINSITDVNSY